MKTVMFKLCLPNGTEMAVIRENGKYSVQANGMTFFSNEDYQKCRDVLIA